MKGISSSIHLVSEGVSCTIRFRAFVKKSREERREMERVMERSRVCSIQEYVYTLNIQVWKVKGREEDREQVKRKREREEKWASAADFSPGMLLCLSTWSNFPFLSSISSYSPVLSVVFFVLTNIVTVMLKTILCKKVLTGIIVRSKFKTITKIHQKLCSWWWTWAWKRNDLIFGFSVIERMGDGFSGRKWKGSEKIRVKGKTDKENNNNWFQDKEEKVNISRLSTHLIPKSLTNFHLLLPILDASLSLSSLSFPLLLHDLCYVITLLHSFLPFSLSPSNCRRVHPCIISSWEKLTLFLIQEPGLSLSLSLFRSAVFFHERPEAASSCKRWRALAVPLFSLIIIDHHEGSSIEWLLLIIIRIASAWFGRLEVTTQVSSLRRWFEVHSVSDPIAGGGRGMKREGEENERREKRRGREQGKMAGCGHISLPSETWTRPKWSHIGFSTQSRGRKASWGGRS